MAWVIKRITRGGGIGYKVSRSRSWSLGCLRWFGILTPCRRNPILFRRDTSRFETTWGKIFCFKVIVTRTRQGRYIRFYLCGGLVTRFMHLIHQVPHGPCQNHVSSFFLSLQAFASLCSAFVWGKISAGGQSEILRPNFWFSVNPELSCDLGKKFHCLSYPCSTWRSVEYSSYLLWASRLTGQKINLHEGRCIVCHAMWLMISTVWGLNSTEYLWYTYRKRRKVIYDSACEENGGEVIVYIFCWLW